MTGGAGEPRTWTRRRWWLLLTLVFASQLAFIFGLSKPHPVLSCVHRRERRCFILAGNASAELMALWDPTLFAPPAQPGFFRTGLDGLVPPAETRAARGPEPMDYLSLPVGQLGSEF